MQFTSLHRFGIGAVACCCLVLCVTTASAEFTARCELSRCAPPFDGPRPIDATDSLWTEDLTWMEVRDAVKAGYTTIIIGTGGIEQSGPYVVTGKHNYVLKATLPAIAAKLGNALIAPIVKFVPEFEHIPYWGTISVGNETFEALLTDICRSYQSYGFKDIILVGDSGGNQEGMWKVAEALNQEWEKGGKSARVHYLSDYYDNDIWSYHYLKQLGVVQMPDIKSPCRNCIHDDIHYEAILSTIDPELIRMDERLRKKRFELNGIPESPIEKTIQLGENLVEYRATITVDAFKKSQQRLQQ
jgi:creatinine amidohydrolase